MSNEHAFRNRTRAVRGAARAHIRQLRADRLARRTSASASEPPVASSATEDRGDMLTVSTAAAEAVHPLGPAIQDPMEICDGAPDADAAPPLSVVEADSPETAPATTENPADPEIDASPAEPHMDSPEHVGEHNDAIAAAADDATSSPAPDHDEPTDEPLEAGTPDDPTAPETLQADTAPADDAGPDTAEAPVVHRSDLQRLPGAGVGLIWLLQECGVHSLSDLAQCSPERLRERMGLVGQILELDDWIAFAAAECQTERS
jgi:predicted flap endonuclease-1-like 5' DNA nuclease